MARDTTFYEFWIRIRIRIILKKMMDCSLAKDTHLVEVSLKSSNYFVSIPADRQRNIQTKKQPRPKHNFQAEITRYIQ